MKSLLMCLAQCEGKSKQDLKWLSLCKSERQDLEVSKAKEVRMYRKWEKISEVMHAWQRA